MNLAPWIIQDGNYPDFNAGQTAEFAVELYSEAGLSLVDAADREVTHDGDDHYGILAEIVAIHDDAWVIDFGLRGYSDSSPPAGAAIGGFVTGAVCLG